MPPGRGGDGRAWPTRNRASARLADRAASRACSAHRRAWGPTDASVTSPGPAPVKYAGFWRRVGAFLMDQLVVVALVGAILLVVWFASEGKSINEHEAESAVRMLGFLIYWLYASLMESSTLQATLGKLFFGIQVTDTLGERIVSFGPRAATSPSIFRCAFSQSAFSWLHSPGGSRPCTIWSPSAWWSASKPPMNSQSSPKLFRCGRQQAMEILTRVLNRLRDEYTRSGKDRFSSV